MKKRVIRIIGGLDDPAPKLPEEDLAIIDIGVKRAVQADPDGPGRRVAKTARQGAGSVLKIIDGGADSLRSLGSADIFAAIDKIRDGCRGDTGAQSHILDT